MPESRDREDPKGELPGRLVPTAALYIAALLKIQEVARSFQIYALSRIRTETRNQRIDAVLFRGRSANLSCVFVPTTVSDRKLPASQYPRLAKSVSLVQPTIGRRPGKQKP